MSTQAFDNFNLLLQLMQATRNLASNMIRNANTHIAMANAQSPDLPTLTQFVTDAANSYGAIISASTTWANANLPQMTATCALIGATLTDLGNYSAPLTSAVAALKGADKSSYAAIITACNAVIATVPPPASIFGT